MKKCNTCKLDLPLSDFNKNQRKCKSCSAEYYRNYYMKNKESIKKSQQKYNKTKSAAKVRARSYYNYKHNSTEKYLLNAAKGRARKDNLEINITLDDIIIPEKCPALGIPIVVSEGRQNDNSPSIDRIDPTLGYVKGNIIVVSWRANKIKSNAHHSELLRLAEFYSKIQL